MSLELRLDKKKRAFTLTSGQYEYSNTVNDEIIKIVTLDTLSLRRRLYITREHINYKYELLKENINEIIELISLDLPAVAEIINDEYKSSDIERCYDDLYNLFFLVLSDGSQLTELTISQNECEDRYSLPRLEIIPKFDTNIKVDYSDCKTDYEDHIQLVSCYFWFYVLNDFPIDIQRILVYN